MDILRAEGISKTYRTGSVEVKALKQCSINIQKGDFYSCDRKKRFWKVYSFKNIGDYR